MIALIALLQVKRTMEKERADVEFVLSSTKQELETCIQKQKETELRAQEAEARNAGMQELSDLVQTRDEEIATLMQKVMRLEDDVEERDQRSSGLQDEVHKLNTELQGIKQLSHDETVQALQMARQKAATYEALTLLNEEKKALEEQLRLVQERLEAERVALHEERDAKEHILAALDAHVLIIEELRKEHAALLEQQQNSRATDKAVREATTQTDEELISPETHAQLTSELEETQRELGELQDELENLQQELEELQQSNEDLRHDQEQKELGHKKTVSRERYKSESFQSQLKLLQNENGELSDKMESLLKDLAREQQFSDAQTLELTELKQRVLSREAIYLLRKTQDSLEQTVNSLLEAEHASESTVTCLQCMQLFTQPMTLAPCGHTYCSACLAKCGNVAEPSSISCKMCESGTKKDTECIFPNYALADLTARFIFRQQSLASLTTMCLALRNSFTQRDLNASSTANLPET
jgi:myosin heavy subunit